MTAKRIGILAFMVTAIGIVVHWTQVPQPDPGANHARGVNDEAPVAPAVRHSHPDHTPAAIATHACAGCATHQGSVAPATREADDHRAGVVLTPAEASVLEDFTDTVEDYRQAPPAHAADATADLLAAAEDRRPVMARLIRDDAAQAFAHAMPPHEIAALPQAVQARMERHVTAIADLNVLCAFHPDTGGEHRYTVVLGEHEYGANVMAQRRPHGPQRDVPIYALVLDRLVAVHEQAGRPLAASEVAARGLEPDAHHALIGETVHSFDSVAGMEQELAAQADTDTVGITAHPEGGSQRLLFIRVDFAEDTGDPTSASNLLDLTSDVLDPYYRENSYGTVDFSGDVRVTDTLRMPKSKDYYKKDSNYIQLLYDARDAALDANSDWNYRNFDNSEDNNTDGTTEIGSYGVILPNTYGWAGLAAIEGDVFWIDGPYNLQVIGHELGHNFGLRHSNGWKIKDGNPIDPSAGSSGYRHAFCLMGNRVNNIKGHFSAFHKWRLGWIPSDEGLKVNDSIQTTLYAHDQMSFDSGQRAIFCRRDSGTSESDFYYIMEVRTRYGDDSIEHGVEINWNRNTDNEIHLIDLSPDTSTNSDSGLRMGTTLSDYAGSANDDIHLTALRPVAGDIPGVEVVVNLDTAAGNSAPTGTISQTYAGAGSDITLTAHPEDADGDTVFAYFWTFDDGSVSLDGSPDQVRSWSEDGTYTVSCTISDCKGGVTTVTQDIHVGVDADQPLVTDATAADVTTPTADPATVSVTYGVGQGAIDVATIGDGDITVTGPDAFSADATLVAVSDPGGSNPVTATYAIAAPGATWDGGENGTYEVMINAGEVAATSGKTVPADTLTTYDVSIHTTIDLVRPTTADVTIPEGVGLVLDTTVNDNGLPQTLTWSVVSGPDTVNWDATDTADTGARFAATGTYHLRLSADDGEVTVNRDLTVQVGGEATAPYTAVDIGNVDAAGSTSESEGVYTVVGSGADIWNDSDECQFAYKSLQGDGELIARVTITDNPGNHEWAKAGLMMRASLDPDSAAVCTLVTDDNGNRFQYRTQDGENTSSSGSGNQPWLKLVRSGDSFTGYASDDGSTWTELGTQTVVLPDTVYAGFAVTSHSDGDLTTATFSDTNFGSANIGALVDAGSTVNGTVDDLLALNGTASDDGLPSDALTTTWQQHDGPGVASFTDATALDTTVSFDTGGTAILRLVADDGAIATFDDTTATIIGGTRAITIAVRQGNDYPVIMISIGANEIEQTDSNGVLFEALIETLDHLIEFGPIAPTAGG